MKIEFRNLIFVDTEASHINIFMMILIKAKSRIEQISLGNFNCVGLSGSGVGHKKFMNVKVCVENKFF